MPYLLMIYVNTALGYLQFNMELLFLINNKKFYSLNTLRKDIIKIKVNKLRHELKLMYTEGIIENIISKYK